MRRNWRALIGGALAPALFAPAISWAQEAPKIDTGDTAWLLTSTALVLLMTPGLALFYAGMVRRKNVLGTMMHSFILMGVVSVLWALYGYSLAFHEGGFWGGFDWSFLNGVGADPDPYGYAGTIPHTVFMAFQLMFAIITPALITGAVAERMRFKALLLFMVLWITFVYDPLAHWVWGKGGLLRFGDPGAIFGALDFAGGTVVHISSGVSALVLALVMGKRLGGGGICRDPLCNRRRDALLELGRVDAPRKANCPRYGLRCGCRARCDHTRFRLRDSDVCVDHRNDCRSGLLLGMFFAQNDVWL